MHLAQELLLNIHCSRGLRSFAKEARALTVRSTVAGYRKSTMLNWEDHQSWSSYNYTRSCQRPQHQPVYSCLALEANWKGEKAQEAGTSWADHKKKKNHFEVSSSLILHNNNDFSMKRILYHNQQWPAQWLDWEEAPKHFPKPNLCPKEVMVTVQWSAAHLTHHSFLNSRETITSEMYAQWVDEMHQKLQGLEQALIRSSVQLLSHVQLFATPWTAAHQASPSITNSQSLLKLMSIESVIPSNHLILCRSLLLPPSIFPRSKASVLWCSAFFIVQLSHPYMSTGKTIALTRQTKVMSLLFNMLSSLVIDFFQGASVF